MYSGCTHTGIFLTKCFNFFFVNKPPKEPPSPPPIKNIKVYTEEEKKKINADLDKIVGECQAFLNLENSKKATVSLPQANARFRPNKEIKFVRTKLNSGIVVDLYYLPSKQILCNNDLYAAIRAERFEVIDYTDKEKLRQQGFSGNLKTDLSLLTPMQVIAHPARTTKLFKEDIFP